MVVGLLLDTQKKRKLWYVHGQAYDLQTFLGSHPGGKEALIMARGLNATELFETYHFARSPPEWILEKYRVNENNKHLDREALKAALLEIESLSDMEKKELLGEKFLFEKDGFYAKIKAKAKDYFVKNNLTPRATLLWQTVAIFQLVLIAALMYPSFIMGNIWIAALFGAVKGVTAVGTGHAMSHYSLFKGKWNIIIFRFGSPLVLSNPTIWSTSHVISHHVNTLTDIDLQDNYPLKRVQPALPHLWFHKFQHFYIWPVYLFGLPLWTAVDFFSTIPTIFTGKHEMRYFPLAQRIENLIVFGLNLLLTVAFPFFFLEFYHALTVSVIANAVSSLIVVLQITVNHEVPDTMSKLPDGKIDWGIHQVLTSHNFSTTSLFWLHCSGGLNMQLEHHLFPSVHYVHYHALAEIVKKSCAEYNLDYNTSSSLFEALTKHYHLLKFNSTK